MKDKEEDVMSELQKIFTQKTKMDDYIDESFRLIKEKDARYAFLPEVWEMLTAESTNFYGKKILVPSSGDNFAVFAFSLLGASILSTDFTHEVLVKAKNRANEYGLDNIDFKGIDTMGLNGLPSNEYDLVFTSNGTYNCLNDIQKAHDAFFRVLKPNGIYCFYENHPFYSQLSEDIDRSGVYKGNGLLKFDIDKYKTFTEIDSCCNFYCIEDYTTSLMNAGFSITDYCDIHRPKNAIPIFARRGFKFVLKDKLPIWIGIRAIKPN